MLFGNPKNIIGFDDRAYVIAGAILNTQTTMAIYYTGSFFEVSFQNYLVKWFGEFLIILILWITIRDIYLQIIKRFKGFDSLKKRLLIMPLFLIPYYIIGILYLEFLQPIFHWGYINYPLPSFPVQFATGAIVLFANLGFYECLLLIVELKNIKVKEEVIKKEKITSQLMNLKNQISPHFLFNSLSTLIHLIDTDSEKSKEFVHKLANVYKSTLEVSDKNLVSLKEELKYINTYTSLLQERFGSNVNFKIKIQNEDKHKRVIPLSLQLAVENAVKHNIITKKQPLNINIQTENDYLIIKNNLQKKLTNGINYGLGLENITKRYKLLTNRRVIIENGKLDFILKLPLLSE
ncbi:sensor histidine kinase [Croceitalea rosinachiae]|uniref:Histidine kinase n=1 Tax=Croceitalea rosinachiae TaxID=3075596 RepID=A0ABU3ACU3_9FLAO|nr:histidine kinase [Croceitalea sp. F388]MDT0608001.1 histidine kinase [Croceitalea sp. F388]